MSRAEITALGFGQLVNWGVLYYAFPVLLQPLQVELGVPAWAVTGAFSVALLVSALLAPAVGRWSDRGHAHVAIVIGGLGGAALLILWALVPSVLTLYVAWAGLGVCMALALYEPAFAIVTRAHGSAESRLHALAVVTLYGGLASTVFLPVTGALVAWRGWRGTVVALAGLMVVSSAVSAFGARHARSSAPDVAASAPTQTAPATPVPKSLGAVFGLSSLASASFIANLVPALGEHGVAPPTAALLGGLFGLMQLPGRALVANQRLSLSPEGLLGTSLGLQAVGLAAVAALPNGGAAAGVVTFAAGAGLTTLARPYLVQSRFPTHHAGFVNGRIARAQALMRGVGPIAGAVGAGFAGHAVVLVSLALVLAGTSWLAVFRRPGPGRDASVDDDRRPWIRGPRLSDPSTRSRLPHE